LNPRGGNVGIGTTNATQRLDIGAGNVRIGAINTNAGNSATDRIVVADGTGILKTVAASAIATKTANYNFTASDETVLVNAGTATVTITLPVASTVSGKKYYVKKTNTSGVVRVTSNGGAIDDFAAGTGISWGIDNVCYGFQSDGSNWYIISKHD
jgi:hypothetical protein